MTITFRWNDIELSRDDFDNSLRDWVAFTIAFLANTQCSDKEVALDLLRYDADSIINKVREGNQ